ncbi:glycosyltransferase family 2 protein [Anaerophaga thermohalophila]|uniref:glycosyltransferase family 2 protein n=1 Tax=Anaerophaga thermohalophila TaxID=177400 RepID=UPI0002E9EF43|nr:glycosyltransferase family 2 protein [Anaerophaga thermohalophila]
MSNKTTDITTSIIIVTYNCANVIEEAILSCIENVNTETIIVDNASTDCTKEIVAQYSEKHLVFISNNTNKGFTQACNQGIKAAQGKYIMLLNPDASLQPLTIPTLLNYIENNQNVGAVAPSLYYPDGTFQNYTRRFPTICGLWVESFVPRSLWNFFPCYRKYTYQDLDFSSLQIVEQPAGAALLFRNKWLLDETFFIYGSDVDLCKTIISEGYQIVQLPESKVLHLQSKGGTENKELRLYLDLDNYYGMNYFFKKHHQQFKAFLYRLVFGLSLFLRSILALFMPHSLPIRWKKFILFAKNKNFTAFYEQ